MKIKFLLSVIVLLVFSLSAQNATNFPCLSSVNAGNDIEICQPGGNINLDGSYTGTPFSVEWSPITGLKDFKDPKTQANITSNSTYTLTVRGHTGNFVNIVNNNFEAGNSGFTSEYIYQPNPGAIFEPGYYTVNPFPKSFNGGFSNCGDHTSGNGNMLIMDCSMVKGKKFWCQNIALTPNTEYAFEFWAVRVYPDMPSKVQVVLGGKVVGLVDINSPVCEWKKYTVFFNSNGLTNTDMCLKEITGVHEGNDFAIDDLSLEEVCTVKDQVSVIVNPVKSTIINASTCEGQPYKVGSKFYMTSGTYKIPFQTWKSCDSIVTLNLEVINVIAEILPPASLTCKNNKVSLYGYKSSSGPEYTYEWTTNNGKIESDPNSQNIEVSAPGSYKLIVTYNKNGLICKKTANIDVVRDIVKPSIDAGPNGLITCKDSIINLNGSISFPISNFSINWTSNNGTIISKTDTIIPQITSSGVYYLNVINNSNGCTSVDSTIVYSDLSKPQINIAIADTLNCKKTTIDLSELNLQQGLDYNWNTFTGNIIGDSGLALITVNQPGIYYLSVTKVINGCTSYDSVKVIQDIKSPDISIQTPGNITCLKQYEIIRTSNKTSDIPVQYLWTTKNGLIDSGINTDSIHVSKEGIYELVSLNLNNGCIDKDSVEVKSFTEIPIVNAGKDTVFNCCHEQIQLNGTYQYSGKNILTTWHTENGNIVSGDNSLGPHININGLYQLKVIDSITGCYGIDTILVKLDKSIPDALIVDPGIINCYEPEKDLFLNNYQNNWTYDWKTLDGNIKNASNQDSVIADKAGKYEVKITNTNNCCSKISDIDIKADIKYPDIDAGNDLELTCLDTVLILNGIVSNSKAKEINWTGNNNQQIQFANTLNPSVNNPGIYFLNVKDISNGCFSIDSLSVTENKFGPTGLNLEILPSICDNNSKLNIMEVIGGDGPYLYSLNGSTFQANNTYYNLNSGSYSFIVQDNKGCNYEELIQIPEIPLGSIELPNSITVELGDSVQLTPVLVGFTPQDITSIKWKPDNDITCVDCLEPLVKPLNTQKYILEIVNKSGCLFKSAINVFVNKELNVFIPNAFSPNSDGVNDTWKVFYDPAKVKRINKIAVFDRWGETLWTALDISSDYSGWDGKFNGRILNSGVYIYYAEVEFIDGSKQLLKGEINLMR